MEATRSSETSVLTNNTRRKIPEDGLLHSHRRENLKSYLDIFLIHCHRSNIMTATAGIYTQLRRLDVPFSCSVTNVTIGDIIKR
jgi:hypothetical protein